MVMLGFIVPLGYNLKTVYFSNGGGRWVGGGRSPWGGGGGCMRRNWASNGGGGGGEWGTFLKHKGVKHGPMIIEKETLAIDVKCNSFFLCKGLGEGRGGVFLKQNAIPRGVPS